MTNIILYTFQDTFYHLKLQDSEIHNAEYSLFTISMLRTCKMFPVMIARADN